MFNIMASLMLMFMVLISGSWGWAGSRKDFRARRDSQPDGGQHCWGQRQFDCTTSFAFSKHWPSTIWLKWKLELKSTQTIKNIESDPMMQVKSTLLDDIQKIMQEGDSREKVVPTILIKAKHHINKVKISSKLISSDPGSQNWGSR